MKAFLTVLIIVCGISSFALAEEPVANIENAVVAETLASETQAEASGIAQIKKTLLEARAPVAEAKNDFQGWRTESEVDIKEKSFDVFKALVLCLGVFCIVIYFLKRMNRGVVNGGDRRIKVIEKVQIASKTSLVLVELDGKPLLFSLGNDRVSVLNSEGAAQSNEKSTQLRKFSESLESVCEEDIQLSA